VSQPLRVAAHGAGAAVLIDHRRRRQLEALELEQAVDDVLSCGAHRSVR
jgi:hypothetical protein